MIASYVWVFIEFVYIGRMTRPRNRGMGKSMGKSMRIISVTQSKTYKRMRTRPSLCDCPKVVNGFFAVVFLFETYWNGWKLIFGHRNTLQPTYINMYGRGSTRRTHTHTPPSSFQSECPAILAHIYFVYWFYGRSYWDLKIDKLIREWAELDARIMTNVVAFFGQITSVLWNKALHRSETAIYVCIHAILFTHRMFSVK